MFRELNAVFYIIGCGTFYHDKRITGYDYIGLDPNGTYTYSPAHFAVNTELRIEADIIKDTECNNHFIAISSYPFGYDYDWKWGREPGVLKIGWNCADLVVSSPDGDAYAYAGTSPTPHLTIIYTPTNVRVTTDIDSVDISLAGRYWSQFWLWIGANDDEYSWSYFDNVMVITDSPTANGKDDLLKIGILA